MAATMSKYLIDEIERTPNMELRPKTEVVEAIGVSHPEGERLSALQLRGPQGEYRVDASSLFVFIGAAPGTPLAAGQHSARCERLFAGRNRPAPRRQAAGKLDRRTRALPAGVKCSWRLYRWRCSPRLDQAGGFGGWRRLHCRAVCAPVFGRYSTVQDSFRHWALPGMCHPEFSDSLRRTCICYGTQQRDSQKGRPQKQPMAPLSIAKGSPGLRPKNDLAPVGGAAKHGEIGQVHSDGCEGSGGSFHPMKKEGPRCASRSG